MLVTDILSLVETLRKLASRKAELDKEYLENFIQPTWEAFEKVHLDYKNSFTEYIRLLSEKDCDIPALIEKIHQDSLQTEDLRVNFSEILKSIPQASFKAKEKSLRAFIYWMSEYIDTRAFPRTSYDQEKQVLTLMGDDVPDEVIEDCQSDEMIEFSQAISTTRREYYFPSLQRRRVTLVLYLSRHSSTKASDIAKAKDYLNKAILELQYEYHLVANKYHTLRKEFLS